MFLFCSDCAQQERQGFLQLTVNFFVLTDGSEKDEAI